MDRMDVLSEINAKYLELEAEADKTLEKAKREEERLQKLEAKAVVHSMSSVAPKQLSYKEARQRNANLLKAIDIAKARLRSRSTFSPLEQVLEKAIQNYKIDLLNTSTATHGEQVRSRDFYHGKDHIYETLQ